MGVSHDGIDKVASSWTLHGWSPPWTRAAITLRGLKSPSTWMYDSTTYRNHGKNLRVTLRLQNLLKIYSLLSCTCMSFTFRCSYSRYACAGCIACYLTCAKICLSFKRIKNCTFCLVSVYSPPSRPTLSIPQLVSELWSPLLWFNHLGEGWMCLRWGVLVV